MSMNEEICPAYNFLKLSKTGVNKIEILNPDPVKPVSVKEDQRETSA